MQCTVLSNETRVNLSAPLTVAQGTPESKEDQLFDRQKVRTYLHTVSWRRSYSKRVVDIPNVGFYSLPKIMGRTGRFIYDGLRLISLGCKQKQKNTNIVQKPNTALVAVGHFPLSPYRLPVGSSANKSLHWGYR